MLCTTIQIKAMIQRFYVIVSIYYARKRVVLTWSIMSGFLLCIFSTFISKHEKDHSAHKNHESDMKNECLPATNKRVDK